MKDDINGKFKVAFPMPGPKGPGNKAEATLTLAVSGNTLSGTMTDPDDAAQLIEIHDAVVNGNQFSFSAKSGAKVFKFAGSAGREKLLMTESTTESFVLDAGTRIKTSKASGVDGAYLVPVHSPGGAMDNIIFLKADGSALEGKMVMVNSPVRDWSDFYDGTVEGNKVSFYSKTSQSTFHFTGEASSEAIQLTLEVIDQHENIEGMRMAVSAGR